MFNSGSDFVRIPEDLPVAVFRALAPHILLEDHGLLSKPSWLLYGNTMPALMLHHLY